METLFDPRVRQSILARLDALRPDSARRWGKMDPARMLAHVAIAMEGACGGGNQRQTLLGKLVTPLILGMVLGEKPFTRSSPTDPTYVVPDARDFGREKARLAAAIERFTGEGPAAASASVHPFFGKLTGEQWGRLTFKHLDHHLRQFGV